MLADSHTLGLAIECMGDIAASVTRTHELVAKGQLTPPKFRRECRNISTQVRKLILPSSEELLKRCFTPTMHPLKQHQGNAAPDTLVQWIGNMSIEYSEGGCSEKKVVRLPSEHEHETVIGPFCGLRRTGYLTYQIEDPFDWSATPLRVGQWMNRKVLQVDDLTMNAESLLRMMVNREGAHVVLNEMATRNPAMPVNLMTGNPDDEPYRRANVINFSGISYVQIFTFLVGAYIVRMMQATLQQIPTELARLGIPKEVAVDILQSPTQLPPFILKADRAYEMGVLLQNTQDTDRPFRMVGDYQTPSRTVARTP